MRTAFAVMFLLAILLGISGTYYDMGATRAPGTYSVPAGTYYDM